MDVPGYFPTLAVGGSQADGSSEKGEIPRRLAENQTILR
jgi:hypothetical protein